MLRTKNLPIPQATSLDVSVCGKRTECMAKTAASGGSALLAEESQMGICKDHPIIEKRWMVCGQETGAADSPRTGSALAQAQASWA